MTKKYIVLIRYNDGEKSWHNFSDYTTAEKEMRKFLQDITVQSGMIFAGTRENIEREMKKSF